MSLREAIVSELLAVQPELSKTKQGPHLLRKLDADRSVVISLAPPFTFDFMMLKMRSLTK